MSDDRAQLSSVATALGELTSRVTDAADRYQAAEVEDVAAELYEVERALTNAGRRLDAVVRRLN